MAWSDPKTWTADELLTASDMNQYLSDNLSALYALVQGGGRKNLLHNGAMQVHQRGTPTASITSPGYYTADRWQCSPFGLGTWTSSVEADAPTGSGFRKSLKMLITAGAETPTPGGATDFVRVVQTIEGQNLQSAKKGTADAEPLTLSFWTKSNKTGVYVVELKDADNTRSVSATYTVASSGTWEPQTVTFPADLTGAFDNDNAGSLEVSFWLAAGSGFTSGTLQTTWAATTTANRVVGQTNLASDTNNYWMVTGVQLEVGSASTGFEFKGYEQELAECQRYYYRVATGTGVLVGFGYYYATTQFSGNIPLPVEMRIAPAFANVTGTGYFTVNCPGPDAMNSITIASDNRPGLASFYNGTEAAGPAGGYAGAMVTSNASAVVALTADL